MLIDYIILGILSFCIIGYVLVLKKFGFKNPKEWIYLIQIFTFFLGFFIISDFNYDFIINSLDINIANNSWLFVFGTTSIYSAIFFIPVSMISAMIRSRKNIFYIAYSFFFVSAVLTLVVPSLPTVIISTIFCGMALSTNSLWYVSFNENFLNDSRPFYAVGFLMPAFFLGNLIAINLQNIIGLNGNGNLLMGIAIGIIAISFLMNIFLKENQKTLGAFDIKVRDSLMKFKWIKVFSVLFLLFIITSVISLGTGDFYRLFVGQLDYQNNVNFDSFRQYLFIAGEMIGAFVGCRLIINSVSVKNSITTFFGIIILYFAVIPWINDSIIIMCLSFVFGISASSVFCLLLSLILSYNARIVLKPITGIFSGLNALIVGLNQYGQRLILINHFGNNVVNEWHISNNDIPQNIFFWISCSLILLCSIGILYNNLRAKYFMSEYYWTHKNNAWLTNFDKLMEIDNPHLNLKLMEFKPKGKGMKNDKR
ncbi:hypothetical protein [Spiroplasma endosymbiont of Amphibalanus improvisus]|uniref:hypothetical protein n=1 Tax=Spiroplasma endosymbiont of Amphibalanus improvisus TaxID=3066327 RepID=UPI00313E22ED